MVPTLSILFMAVSAIISIGLPILLYLYWRKRYALRLVPALVGAVAFTLFALVLEQQLHMLVLRPDAEGGIALRNNPFLYVLYGTLAAGVFEETARFASFSLLRRKHKGFGTALSYGIGHGGIESILVCGVTMIANIAFSMTLNANGPESLSSLPQSAAAINALQSSAPTLFLFGGLERVLALTMQISLSVLVFYAVYASGKRWLYPAAIALHALIDVPAALFQCGVITGIALVEGIVAVSAVILAFIAVSTHRKLSPTLSSEAPPPPSPDEAEAPLL